VFSARNELFEDGFNEYAVPEAVLRFRQGFGRLIRSKTDRGAFIVLDRRILTKAYGRSFQRSLPKSTVRRTQLAELEALARKWKQGEEV
jgi:DNA polymerase-3 subunit epsilon/ATP-dependent DNA helicase DinG